MFNNKELVDKYNIYERYIINRHKKCLIDKKLYS